MKTLYLDCGMGAAGDMLAAALLELIPERDGFVSWMNSFGLPGVAITQETSVKCGIAGTHFSVKVHGEEESHDHHDHEHHHDHHYHSGIDDISHIVYDHLPIPQKVKEDIMAVYELIAEAESHSHGVPVSAIHFHEVGTMDAITDITAVCLLMNEIAPDEVIVSPVHVGSGTVWCAHGVLPVPAPATTFILKDVPIYGGSIQGELCTPTGAAVLKHFVTSFEAMPPMNVTEIGYGMGTKDFAAANCVRVFLGESSPGSNTAPSFDDSVLSISCNLDDMTGEAVGFATELLLQAGALDVYTIPIQMKKNRPGILLTCICEPKDRERLTSLFFLHTTTRGVRYQMFDRAKLTSEIETCHSAYGDIRIKKSCGYGVEKEKAEFEDLKAISAGHNYEVSLDQIRDTIVR